MAKKSKRTNGASNRIKPRPSTGGIPSRKKAGTNRFQRVLEMFRRERELEGRYFPVMFEKRTWYMTAFFTLFVLSVLWPVLSRPDQTPGGYDMTTAVPFKWLWIDSLKRFDPIFWDPYTSLGIPALPYGAYNPYNPFFLLIHPISYAFTWIYVVHFVLAALFTYIFIRGLGCGWESACLGSLAFVFSGFFMGHYYWGHPSIVWAACWMPLYMVGFQRFVNHRSFSSLVLASVAVGLGILEGYPQITMYGMMIVGLWLGWAWLAGKINWKELLGAGVVLAFITFSLTCCQLMPSYQFSYLSDRWVWPVSDFMKDIFMPQYFHFFINPFFLGGPGHGDYKGMWGYQEVVAYIGLIPLFLALGGFLRLLFKRPVVWWLAFLALFATVLAMAGSTPFTKVIFMFFFNYLPGFGKNRSLARIMLLTFFALACLAALGLEAWIDFWRGKNLGGLRGKILLRWVPIALLALSSADLWHFAWVNTSSGGGSYNYNDYWDPWRMMDPKIIKMAQDDPTYPRVQPETTADSDYEIIHKVQAVMTNITQIQWTYQYLQDQWSNSETPLPDLIRLTYRWRPAGFVPTERWQGIPGFPSFWTDTKAFPRSFMVGGYSVNPDYQQTIYSIRDQKVDLNQEVVLNQDPPDKPNWPAGWVGEAKITHYDWNDLEIDCANDRPCFLFLSDSYYPGWKAWVDGKEEPLYRANAAFRALELREAGHHTVKMSYHPSIIIYSFYYSLFSWIILALLWFYRKPFEAWYSSLFGGKLIFATSPEILRAEAQAARTSGRSRPAGRRKK